jgi:excinuclease ABC subunit A
VIDMGPAAGEHGGRVVAVGTPEQVMRSPESITGQYLTGAPDRRAGPPAQGHPGQGSSSAARARTTCRA